MSNIPQDLTGKQFGRWTVLGPALKQGPHVCVLCACECGTVRVVQAPNLRSGRSVSCGCFRREDPPRRFTTHGGCGTPEYQVWEQMKARCLNPNHTYYYNYGGRGITVCARWRSSFAHFLQDMGSRPSPQHTLDRINNDGPYGPENCRWATRAQQSNNTRRNRLLTYKGETLTLAEWAERQGIPYKTLLARLHRDWSDEDALTKLVRRQRPRR